MTIREDRERKEDEQLTKLTIELIGKRIIGVSLDSIRLSNGRTIYISKKEILNIIGE